tara:strand:+ start:274 stop:513 length:240 start_codon:yes stop_codon:yes gene_type:complete
MKKIIHFLCSKLIFDDFDLKNVEKLKQKTETLKKFNGKPVTYGRRGLKIEFETKKDEIAYYSHLRKKAYNGKDFSSLIK